MTDINQGSIGNCWTIASIASIAEDTGDIYKLFDTKERNAAGIYSIRLWNMGIPVSVVIDDYFAFKADNTPAFAPLSPQKEIWPMLLEKAIAKSIANYDFAAVGTPNDAMFIATGAPGGFYTN